MSNLQQLEATETIRLIGEERSSNEVPALVLARVLNGLQQIIYLLAASQEKLEIKQRFRMPSEMQQLYTLRCQVPELGSYAIPIVLKPSVGAQTSRLSDYSNIINKLTSFFESISDYHLNKIQDTLPDSKLRNRALLEARKFLPKSDESWCFVFSVLVTNIVNFDV